MIVDCYFGIPLGKGKKVRCPASPGKNVGYFGSKINLDGGSLARMERLGKFNFNIFYVVFWVRSMQNLFILPKLQVGITAGFQFICPVKLRIIGSQILEVEKTSFILVCIIPKVQL